MIITKKLNKIVLFLAVGLLVVACGGADESDLPETARGLDNLTTHTVDERPDTLLLEAEQVFGTTDEQVIGNINHAAARENGQVLLSDSRQHTIHIFNPDGTYRRNMGEWGKGPGNFNALTQTQASDGKLYVLDGMLARISVFEGDSLEFVENISLNTQNQPSSAEEIEGGMPLSMSPGPDGSFMVGYDKRDSKNESNRMFYRFDRTGQLDSDKLAEGPLKKSVGGESDGTSVQAILPFDAETLFAFSDGGIIVTAWSRDFLIKEHDETGAYQRAFYYPGRGAPLDPETAVHESTINRLDKVGVELDYPDRWPALAEMRFDDRERLWVARYTEDQQMYQWWVLGENGELIARFEWPKDRRIQQIKDGKLYTVERNENDESEAIRYDIKME